MPCTGLSVIRGTAISAFNVEMLDVIGGRHRPAAARASSSACRARPSTRTGVGPGFSGLADPAATAATRARSPRRSASTATTSCSRRRSRRSSRRRARPAARRARRPLLRAARPLADAADRLRPVRPVRRALSERAAQRGRHRAVLAAPARTARRLSRSSRSCPAPRWRHRSRAATSRSARSARSPTATATGLWAFGHPLDGAGPRSLFLQDAYVFSVIDNPLGIARRRDDLQARLGRRPRPWHVHERRLRGDRRHASARRPRRSRCRSSRATAGDGRA